MTDTHEAVIKDFEEQLTQLRESFDEVEKARSAAIEDLRLLRQELSNAKAEAARASFGQEQKRLAWCQAIGERDSARQETRDEKAIAGRKLSTLEARLVTLAAEKDRLTQDLLYVKRQNVQLSDEYDKQREMVMALEKQVQALSENRYHGLRGRVGALDHETTFDAVTRRLSFLETQGKIDAATIYDIRNRPLDGICDAGRDQVLRLRVNAGPLEGTYGAVLRRLDEMSNALLQGVSEKDGAKARIAELEEVCSKRGERLDNIKAQRDAAVHQLDAIDRLVGVAPHQKTSERVEATISHLRVRQEELEAIPGQPSLYRQRLSDSDIRIRNTVMAGLEEKTDDAVVRRVAELGGEVHRLRLWLEAIGQSVQAAGQVGR